MFQNQAGATCHRDEVSCVGEHSREINSCCKRVKSKWELSQIAVRDCLGESRAWRSALQEPGTQSRKVRGPQTMFERVIERQPDSASPTLRSALSTGSPVGSG
jgi:hypothetical protein